MRKLWRNSLQPLPIVIISALFFGGFFLFNQLHTGLCERVIPFPCVPYWPISVVLLRTPPNLDYPNLSHVIVAGLSVLILIVGLKILPRLEYRLPYVAFFGLLLILTTTLTHGIQFGFVRPVAGMGVAQVDYYNDAIKIEHPGAFLQNFEDLQPNLFVHSRTHPPYAVLSFFVFARILKHPAVITILISFISTILTVFFLSKLLTTSFRREIVGKIIFLFLLIPAIHIYYAASLDAIIAGLLLGSTMIFLKETPLSWGLSVTTIIVVSMLTFGFLFILPVIFLYELTEFRSIRRSLLLILSVVVFHGLIERITGFNYLNSFLAASRFENPDGFTLLASPATYIMTRLEGFAEVFLFFGPFLTLLMLRSISPKKVRSSLTKLSILALASFLLMLLSGAYRTGETARAALFIYPYLMLAVGYPIRDMEDNDQEFRRLSVLVFAQSLIMQLLGDYYW